MATYQARKWIFLCFKLSVAFLVLWFLISKSQLKMALFYTAIDKPGFALLIIGMFYVMVFFNTWRWYYLNAAQKLTLTFKETWLPTYFGVAFNNVLPGSVGGDFVRLFYLLKKFHTKKSAVILSVMFDRVIGLMGIFVTISLIAIWRAKQFSHDATLFYILSCCTAVCMAGLAFFFLSLLLPRKVGFSAWLSNKFQHKSWLEPIIAFFDAVRVYRHAKWVIIQCVLISVGIQILMVITTFFISEMMGFPRIALVDYAIAIGAAQIANLIPLTPGGLGIGEIAFANVLLLLNPGTSAAYATIFLAFRFFGIVSYLPGVAIYLMNFRWQSQETILNEDLSRIS